MLKKILSYLAADLIKQSYRNGYDKRYAEEKETRAKIEEFRYETLLAKGNKVISLSNEWHEMVVGVIRDYGPHNIPVIWDCVSGEEVIYLGIVIPYSEEMLNALAKLNPFERYSIAASHAAFSSESYIFDKKKVYGAEDEAKLLGVAEFEEVKVKMKTL